MLKRFLTQYGLRSFSNSSFRANLENQKQSPTVPGPAEPPASGSTGTVRLTVVPTEYEKTILVLSGKYKSKDQIPPQINVETMENAKSKFRIRLSNVLIAATFCLCGYFVWKGKKGYREGDSVAKRVLEREKEILEKHRQSLNK